MKINSKEARMILDRDSYVVFRNYATPPDASLFYKAYKQKEDVTNSDDGKPLGSMKIVPEYFFKETSVNNFYDECSNLYGVKTTLLLIEGVGGGSPTTKHSDENDVIHWQCMGKSEWTFYDNLTDSIQFETKIILNAGDVVWFKKGKNHSVQNLEDKFSIIFNEKNILKDFLVKQYAAAGREFI